MPTTKRAIKKDLVALVVVVLAFSAAIIVAKTSRQKFSDTEFAAKAAQGGKAEVQLGKLAEKKGQSEAVRAFGHRMADDHAAANKTLAKVARKEKINLPKELDKESQETYDRLAKLSGPDFDRSYVQDMINDHKKDVSEFKKEASDGKNETIRTFAAETLPTLQDHLKAAREMKDVVSPKPQPIPNIK